MVFQASLAVGMLAVMVIVPFLYKKYSYKQLIIGSCLIGGAAGFAMYLIGYDNFYALIPFLILCSIPLGVINVVTFAMVGDCLDYMEWKTGFRENGLGLACQSFVLKLANALATADVILTYVFIKLDVNSLNESGANLLGVPAEQLTSVRGGMFSLVTIIPAISLLLCIIPVLFYDLTGAKKETITRELAQRREAALAEKAVETAQTVEV